MEELTKIIVQFFTKHRLSIEAPMIIPQSGEYDGCFGFKVVIKGVKNYDVVVLYDDGFYPTQEEAWANGIVEAFKLIKDEK